MIALASVSITVIAILAAFINKTHAAHHNDIRFKEHGDDKDTFSTSTKALPPWNRVPSRSVQGAMINGDKVLATCPYLEMRFPIVGYWSGFGTKEWEIPKETWHESDHGVWVTLAMRREGSYDAESTADFIVKAVEVTLLRVSSYDQYKDRQTVRTFKHTTTQLRLYTCYTQIPIGMKMDEHAVEPGFYMAHIMALRDGTGEPYEASLIHTLNPHEHTKGQAMTPIFQIFSGCRNTPLINQCQVM